MKTAIKDCTQVHTYLQPDDTPICWFTAIMAVLFLSQRMRSLVASKLPVMAGMSGKKRIANSIAKLLSGYARNNAHPNTANSLRPDQFLVGLGRNGRGWFRQEPAPFRTNNPHLYLNRMLDFLDMSRLWLDRSAYAFTNELRLSPWNHTFASSYTTEPVDAGNRSKWTNKIRPEVLLIETDGGESDWAALQIMSRFGHTTENQARKWRMSELGRELGTVRVDGVDRDRHAQTLFLGGHEYVLDGAIHINSKDTVCKALHVMAGVTCNGRRFVYNGWRNPMNNTRACPLMRMDWATGRPFSFKSACELTNKDAHMSTNMKYKSGVFGSVVGSTAIYVRSDLLR